MLNQFTCLVCDVILFNDSYATHFRTKHPTLAKAAQENCEGRVRLACRVCSLKTGLSFKSLEELKAHVATHRIPKKPTPSSTQMLVSWLNTSTNMSAAMSGFRKSFYVKIE